MKFAMVPLVFVFGAVSVTSATASRTSDILKQRQYNPRDPPSNTCGTVSTMFKVPDHLGILTAVGVIDTCLCTSDLPNFHETNAVVSLANTIAGKTVVNDILKSLITDDAASKSCKYPDNSIPACMKGNPCGFTCNENHTPFPASHPTECVNTNPSGNPLKRKKRNENEMLEADCPSGSYSACGIPGVMMGSSAYECVDTSRDIESCGGCLIPLHPTSPTGVDCTELDGVDTVSCVVGSCAVQSCLSGWDVAPSGNSCVQSAPSFAMNGILKAVEFGLEHIPHQR